VNDSRQPLTEDEPVPFPGGWRNLYLFVALELGVSIAALYALTRWAA
jgi:hypothetical protein